MPLNKIRERVNLILYGHKKKLFRVMSALHLVVSFSAMLVMIYYFGFPQTEKSADFLFRLIEYSFIFYIVRYSIKLIYDFAPLKFLKRNWFEGILMLLLLIEGIAHNVWGTQLLEPLFTGIGVYRFGDFSTIFVQSFIFIIILLQIVKQRDFSPWFKVHPALLFMLSIATLTLIGAGMFMLPEMSTAEGGLSFTDSLFMAMSSTSVTGLATVDVPTVLTLKGQIVMMVLIKLGGLNTIAFGALLLVVAKFGVGIKYHEVIEDFVNKDSILKTGSMLGKIILWSSFIEFIGFCSLFISFGSEGIFANFNERIFQSVFHAISGFNNAGLSTLPDGVMHPDVINNYAVHTIILILFFLGGFGMIYLFDLIEPKKIRERIKQPWKGLEFGTKISLYFTLALLLIGALIFFIFEYNNTLDGRPWYGQIITALFESMTTRNAGFSTVDTASIALPVFIFFLFLMFVGASSGSAGGGIRTSTFGIIWASVISTIRGKKHTEIFKRTISNDVVLKAYAIMIFFILGNVIGPFVLAITEADALNAGVFTFQDLVFEHVSAASTVGLSTGITAELTTAGKYVLIVAMFIGRVGTLTLAYLVGKQVLSTKYKYPEGHTMVG